MYPLGHSPPLLCKHISSTWKSLSGYLMAALWRWACVRSVSARSTTRGENTACVLLCESGENAPICSSYDSFSFLPASLLTPYLPWVHRVRSKTHSKSPWSHTGAGMNMILMSLRGLGQRETPRTDSSEDYLGSRPHLLRRHHLRRCICWGPGHSPNNCLPPSPTFCRRTWSAQGRTWTKSVQWNSEVFSSNCRVLENDVTKRMPGFCKSPLKRPGWSACIHWGRSMSIMGAMLCQLLLLHARTISIAHAQRKAV